VNSAPVVIKKYGNRRLYDTSASRYVNLEDIASMIREGTDVQVVDAKTNEDLTRLTLTQIIVEDAKDQPAGLPLEFLRQLIQTSDHVGREFIMWYLKSAVDAYGKMQNALQSGITEVRSAALSPWETMKNLIQKNLAPEPPATPAPPSGELDELRKRIAELEARQQRPKRQRKPRKPRA
jgi:polyhydroxyalkanoate synthesis repressor PhaR